MRETIHGWLALTGVTPKLFKMKMEKVELHERWHKYVASLLFKRFIGVAAVAVLHGMPY